MINQHNIDYVMKLLKTAIDDNNMILFGIIEQASLSVKRKIERKESHIDIVHSLSYKTMLLLLPALHKNVGLFNEITKILYELGN